MSANVNESKRGRSFGPLTAKIAELKKGQKFTVPKNMNRSKLSSFVWRAEHMIFNGDRQPARQFTTRKTDNAIEVKRIA